MACDTESQRHVIVKAPDESIFIAFNEDAPKPNAPSENITESVSQVHSFAIDVAPTLPNVPPVNYPPGSKTLSILLWTAALINLSFHRRSIDIFNFCLISFTALALHSTYSVSSAQLLLHGLCSSLMFIPFCVLGMWGQAVYQIGCASLCAHAYMNKHFQE